MFLLRSHDSARSAMIDSLLKNRARYRLATIVLAWVFAASLLDPATALAQSGTIVQLPMTGKAPKHGITVSIDTTWVEGLGYRPVRVTVTPVATTKADRSFTVQFSALHFWGPRDNITVTQDIEMPAGTTPASGVTETLSVPQHDVWSSFAFQIWENGRYLRELSLERFGMAAGGNGFGADFPKILVVSDGPMDLTPLKEILFADNVAGSNLPYRFVLQPNVNLPTQIAGTPAATATKIALADAPSNWIDLTAVDVICLYLDELPTLQTSHRNQWQAISDWTRAGGNLVIFGLGNEAEAALQTIDESVFGLVATSQSEVEGKSAWRSEPLTGDTKIRLGGYEASISSGQIAGPPLVYGQNNPGTTVATTGWDVESMGRLADVYVRSRRWQLGQVLAVDELSKVAHWLRTVHAIGNDRLVWNDRHGLSFHNDNSTFWEFLIAGVGVVPTNVFRVLITLFVLCIGPANFYLLRNRQRLQFTVITIPIIAFLVTGSLLAYAILADGLHVRTRARSYSQIDQRNGDAVCWARASYYAGLAPSEGLTFSAGTAVHPLEPEPQYNGYRGPIRSMEWDDKQRLTQGWISSRTPAQYVTVRPVRTKRQLNVTPRAETRPLAVENQLGVFITQLWLCDADGRFYYGTDIPKLGKVSLSTYSTDDLTSGLVGLLDENRLRVEPGVYSDRGGRRYRRYYGWRRDEYAAHSVSWHTSRLHRAIQELPEAARKGSLPLGKKSYVAVVENSPFMELGLESDENQESLHVIVGQW